MRSTRHGFTLIEMLVVIAIIVAIAVMALYFSPKTESRLAAQGADQLQTYIASARARAMRDGLLSGVRLIPDQNYFNQYGQWVYREFQFIQAPEAYAPTGIPNNLPVATPTYPALIYPSAPPNNMAGVAYIQIALDVSASVAIGDLLEVAQGVGSVHRVVSLTAAGTNPSIVGLASVPPCASTVATYYPLQTPPGATSANPGFRFIREPRPLMGETTLQLPRFVRVDNSVANGNNLSQNLNALVSYQVTGPTYDILFSPSGQVTNSSFGRVVLWMNDDNAVSQPTLLTIYTRTGGVAAHPIAPGANPYAFTQDGLNSGQ